MLSFQLRVPCGTLKEMSVTETVLVGWQGSAECSFVPKAVTLSEKVKMD